MTFDTVLAARALGKNYRRRWALADCALSVPAGRVVGLVGPNGAGKTTLLRLAVGLIPPSAGALEVLGRPPAESPAQLGRIGFVAQHAPTYPNLTVADHLRLGAWLNPGWDATLAKRRIDDLRLDPRQRAGKLSGGQRAQLALTLAMAKRPELLVLDEPVASLDPLARREFLTDVRDAATGQGGSVILSSHLVTDLERICDYVIVLVASRVRVAGAIEQLLATHQRLSGPRRGEVPAGQVIEVRPIDGHTTALVRSEQPITDPRWKTEPASLEDIVLAYMGTEVPA